MRKLVLEFKGRDSNGYMLFADDRGRYYMHNKYDGLVILSGDAESDPIGLVEGRKEFEDVEIILTGHEDEPTDEDRRNYMLLSRLKMDCEYFLGNGNGYEPHLWAGSVEKQISKMKELYDRFDVNKRPEWIKYFDILEYERLMLKKSYEEE